MTWARDVLAVQPGDGIRQERSEALYDYWSVLKFQKCCFIWTVQPTPHKNHHCCRESVGLHPKAASRFHWKNGLWESFGESIQGDSEIENGTFDIVFDILAFSSSLRQRSCRLKIKIQATLADLSLFWSSSLSDLSIILFAAKFEAFSTINCLNSRLPDQRL